MDNTVSISEQLREVNSCLNGAYSRFGQLSDPDLIESEIYQIKCLEAKRSFLLKLARSEAARPEPAPK